jgi:hypothetical protein
MSVRRRLPNRRANESSLQYGAPLGVLQRALVRERRGVAASPLGAALDLLVEGPK